MIFYLCQTANGPQLAGTQADAKALDPKFRQVDVPTDKASLMAYINNLMSTSVQPVAAPAAPSVPAAHTPPVPTGNPVVDNYAAMCYARETVALEQKRSQLIMSNEWRESLWSRMAIEDWIEQASEEDVIDISETVNRRIYDFEKKRGTPVPANDAPARRRRRSAEG